MVQPTSIDQVAEHVGKRVMVNDVVYGMLGVTTHPQPRRYQGTLEAVPADPFSLNRLTTGPKFRLVDPKIILDDGTTTKCFGDVYIDKDNVHASRVTLVEDS